MLRSRLTWFVGAVFVLTLVPYFVPILDDAAMLDYGDTYADISLIIMVCMVTLVGRPRNEARDERWFWYAVGAGFLTWLVGRVGWAALFEQGLVIDLVADSFFLGFYVCLLFALEHAPGRDPLTAFGARLRRYRIGAGIVLLAAGFGYFVLIPGLLARDTYESWKPAVLGAVVFDAYITVRLFGLWRHTTDPVWRRRYAWLAAGFVLWMTTDALDVVWLYTDFTFLQAGTKIDVLWYLPYAVFLMGALMGRQPAGQVEASWRKPVPVPDLMLPPLGSTPVLVYAFLLPGVHGILEVAGLLDPTLRPARMVLLLVEATVLALLVYRTHRLVYGENERLRQGYLEVSRSLEATNRDLEERVHERTAALEELNRRLEVDIGRRVRVEERLRGTEARNRALFDAIPDALVLLDREGVILEMMPGRDGADPLELGDRWGQPFGACLPVRRRRQLAKALEQVFAAGEAPMLPVNLEADRPAHHLELRFSRCGEDEVLVVIQDVTRRRHAESALQQSQKLESLGVMAGGVAHDFNNLLVSVLGNVQLVQAELPADSDLRAPLAAVESNARRAAKLTDNLLAYAGKAHIAKERLDVARLLSEMRSLLAAAVPKRARLDLAVAEEHLWIDANEAQITQIVLNLVRNAAEALGSRDCRIDVDLARARIPAAHLENNILGEPLEPGPFIRLRVRDTGCGMTPEVRHRIFDPFFTSKTQGRGLGLAAALGIVAHHGGGLTVESVPDQGTTFTIYLPERAAPAANRIVERTAARRFRGTGTVLVADDEPDVRELLVRFLGGLGFEVLAVADGLQAVDQVRTRRGGVVAALLDYSMPGMDGAEALRQIRREDPHLPVIMMSGYGERDALQELESRHRAGFVHKPFDLVELARVLEEGFGLAARQDEG